jgi:hypothetical protein
MRWGIINILWGFVWRGISTSAPTAAQMDSVKELCAWLCQKYELAPTRKGVIVGHHDLNDDADCPGMHLYKRLPEIRQFCEDNR